MLRHKRKKGVTLIEIMMAMIILLIGLSGVAQIFPSTFAFNDKSKKRVIAYALAQSKLERFLYNADWSPDLVKLDIDNNPYQFFQAIEDSSHSNYYYKVNISRVGSGNQRNGDTPLFRDQLTKRISVSVLIPPLNPGLNGWGYTPFRDLPSDQIETLAISQGFIVNLVSFRTHKFSRSATLTERYRREIGANNYQYNVFITNPESFAVYNATDPGNLNYYTTYNDLISPPDGSSAIVSYVNHADKNDMANYTAILMNGESRIMQDYNGGNNPPRWADLDRYWYGGLTAGGSLAVPSTDPDNIGGVGGGCEPFDALYYWEKVQVQYVSTDRSSAHNNGYQVRISSLANPMGAQIPSIPGFVDPPVFQVPPVYYKDITAEDRPCYFGPNDPYAAPHVTTGLPETSVLVPWNYIRVLP